MSEVMIMSIAKKALWAGTLVSGPILLASLLVGLLISIFQATTQIQEQTLTFVPKLIVIMLILLFCGPWMLNQLTTLASEFFGMIATITR